MQYNLSKTVGAGRPSLSAAACNRKKAISLHFFTIFAVVFPYIWPLARANTGEKGAALVEKLWKGFGKVLEKAKLLGHQAGLRITYFTPAGGLSRRSEQDFLT